MGDGFEADKDITHGRARNNSKALIFTFGKFGTAGTLVLDLARHLVAVENTGRLR